MVARPSVAPWARDSLSTADCHPGPPRMCRTARTHRSEGETSCAWNRIRLGSVKSRRISCLPAYVYQGSSRSPSGTRQSRHQPLVPGRDSAGDAGRAHVLRPLHTAQMSRSIDLLLQQCRHRRLRPSGHPLTCSARNNVSSQTLARSSWRTRYVLPSAPRNLKYRYSGASQPRPPRRRRCDGPQGSACVASARRDGLRNTQHQH